MMPAVAAALDRATIAKARVELEAGHPSTASVQLETATALDQSGLFAPKSPGAPNVLFDAHHIDVTIGSGDAWAEAAWALWRECVGDAVLPTRPDVLRAALRRTERHLGSGSDVRAFVVSNGPAGTAVLAWACARHVELDAGTPKPLRATSEAFRIRVTDGKRLGVLVQCARRYPTTSKPSAVAPAQ